MQSTTLPDRTVTDYLSDFNRFWHNVKVLAQPYWYPTKLGGRSFSDVIRTWGMFALLILSVLALVGLSSFNSFLSRYVLDIVIEERDLDKYLGTLWISILGIVLVTILVAVSRFIRKKIALDWYAWLNNHILEKYFSNRAYYQINFNADLDNPDQRLAQEIEPITINALSLLTNFIEKGLEMTIFFVILCSISTQIAAILIVYTTVGNLIAIYLNQELNKINQTELELKADYNYCLTHIRNHAESIAFFRGEQQEAIAIHRKFDKLQKIAERRLNWERNQDIYNRGYQSAISLFSMVILTPIFLQGQIDFGQINQASLASYMFSNALGELIAEFGTSGRFSSYVERLTEFSDVLEAVSKQPDNLSTIITIEADQIAFDDFTLQTPNYQQTIVENLSLSVQPGEGLLIVGPSGRGKSSLLRAIAGLWNAGTGRLLRPPLESILFLPQRPYITLGNLREQLLYPQIDCHQSDSELEAVLEQVNLPHVLKKVGGFDLEVPLENILSIGEQQRIAFARILVTQPSYAILDEATSALDLKNEENLYQQLQQTKTTFISVGHRESLFDYHQWVLELSPDSSWQLVTVRDYRQQKQSKLLLI